MKSPLRTEIRRSCRRNHQRRSIHHRTRNGLVICAALVVASASCLVFPAPGICNDFFVNNILGDDRNSGFESGNSTVGRQNGPLKTIGRALQVARTGDRIIVQKTEQPYRECLSVQGPRHNGTALKKFHIVSNGAVLDGTREVGDRWEYTGNDIFRFQPERKSYQQLFLDGRPLPQTRLGEFDSVDALEQNQWTLHEGWIYFRTDGINPAAYNLSYCYHPVGVTLYQVHDVAIEGFVIQGFHLDGINAHDGVTNTVLVSNVLRGNGRTGLSVGGASSVEVVACLLGDNGSSQLRTEGQSRTILDRCDLVESDDFGPPIHQVGGRIAKIGD